MEENLHATAVAIDGRGLLILGRAGAGKSSLAMRLMALGAGLVADDRVLVRRQDDRLTARAPAPLAGLIEARGIGLLRAPYRPEVDLTAVVDLDQPETDRLPPLRHYPILGVTLPLVLGQQSDHFPFGLMLYMRYGRGDQGQR